MKGINTVNIDRILSDLRTEKDRIERAIAALEGGDSPRRGRPVGSTNRRKRKLTPEGRRRLCEMMKKRWAERRKHKAA